MRYATKILVMCFCKLSEICSHCNSFAQKSLIRISTRFLEEHFGCQVFCRHVTTGSMWVMLIVGNPQLHLHHLY